MKINKSHFFNKFILIWIVFGLCIYIYSIVDVFLNKKQLINTISLKYLLIFLVLIFYILAYFKFKRENIDE